MARSRQDDESLAAFPKEVTAPRHQDLEILGETSAACASAVHPQSQAEGRRPTGSVTTSNVVQLLEWQGYRCALTGRPLTPQTASLDHVIPVRNGGEHTIENVQVLHKEVNRAKSTMTHQQFVQMCREVVDHVAFTKLEGASK